MSRGGATTLPVALLGQIAARLPMIDVACNRCDRRGWLSTARPMSEHGSATPVPVLLRTIAADCPGCRRDDSTTRAGCICRSCRNWDRKPPRE